MNAWMTGRAELNHRGMSHHPGLANVSLQVGHFEFLALHEQMELVVNSDLLFGVHGAGMLQGVFLSKCSMLIEMFAIGGGHPKPWHQRL